MRRLLCSVLLGLSLVACGASQRVLSTQALVHRAHQAERFDFYGQLDARCGDEHPDDREAYHGCMAPARHIARAADSYRQALETAQHLLDASDEETFRGWLPHLLRAAGDLIGALDAAGVPVPEELTQLSALVE